MDIFNLDLESIGWDFFFEDNFAKYKEEGLIPGRISEVQRKNFVLLTKNGEIGGRISGKLRFEADEKNKLPVVGDWVALKIESNTKGTIHAVLPRKSKFSRKVPGKVTEEQVMISNVDTVWIVSGLDQDFNIQRIERYLMLVSKSGAKPVLVLNKADICIGLEDRIQELKKIAPTIPIHTVSAELNEGMGELYQYLGKGKTVALLGSSGVGKSTITNKILGFNRQKVGSVREWDSHGRHITTFRELIILPKGGMIIDNPGMRELQLWSEDEDINQVFDDIEILSRQCKFSDCTHTNEPGCAVKNAIENGGLDLRRYEHYLKLKKELKFLSIKQNGMARVAEKARGKNISKYAKVVGKLKTREY
ncbi:MAG TPA: ribosome small subunit-dependent GTPase A [Methanofastidiosum sp.]|nr:ribosome small subunit-dependent GTPase A [Methanofastidiosum sp.]HOG74051.1 ribosome small subunit-dependent GTPase A [Methanofastidiosum sp.]